MELPAQTAARIAANFSLLTGQWNFPALLQRIVAHFGSTA
jgi:hypothetical protein